MTREGASAKIREAVKRFGTRRALAARMGVSDQALKMWEIRGVVPYLRLKEFCELTGAKPDDVNPTFCQLADEIRQLRSGS